MPSEASTPKLVAGVAATGAAAIALLSGVLTPVLRRRHLATRDDLPCTASNVALFVIGHGFAGVPRPLGTATSSGTAGTIEAAARLFIDIADFRFRVAERDEFLRLCRGDNPPTTSGPATAPGELDALLGVFPHVLAQPLMIAIMTNAAFPLRAIGGVHLRSIFRVHDRAALTAALTVAKNEDVRPMRVAAAYLGAKLAASGNGVETFLILAAFAGDTLLWSEVVVIYKAGKLSHAAFNAKYGGHAVDEATLRQWWPESVTLPSLPADGASPVAARPTNVSPGNTWDFGILTGDVNPIHMSAFGARLFGQAGRVAHGALVVAKCLTRVGRALPDAWAVQFKAPVPCDAPVAVLAPQGQENAGGTLDLAVVCANGVPKKPGKPNICIRPVAADGIVTPARL